MTSRKPFRAGSRRNSRGKVVPFRASPARRRDPEERRLSWIGFALIVLAVFLFAFGLAMRFGIPSFDGAGRDRAALTAALPAAGPADTLSARFSSCDGPTRRNCVVDGDTFWFAGDKIRILDINTPEISTPQCDAEYALGMRATARLAELLNAGRFSLQSGPEDTDRYGRKLRRVVRGGESLGNVLVREGLAEEWRGYRGSWC